ncbi:MAG: Outer membrane beta-barrel assembly protein BamB [Burkholderiaceae bacterium]|jgi:outer membrane assembly lipoprotein YfgL|nr:MAG: Outer membrane beta-barrel assembly protein BamB [Burkholderiaceae bacterium]
MIALLSACSTGSPPPKPTPLGPNEALIGVRQAWAAQIGPVGFPLEVKVEGNSVLLASSDGTVAALDARTGHELWRVALHQPVAAGVGSDGRLVAVVTADNHLVALQDGHELWRRLLESHVFTAPLVAGARVFVLAGDRAVSAYDGQSGRRLWQQKPPAQSLVLRQAGVITSAGDTLLIGLSGRLVGLNPADGSLRWDALIGALRGTNDIERLSDLVAPVARLGSEICARAYQAAVGCVDTANGQLEWSQKADGATGLAGDERFIYGTESDGKVIAWRREGGEQAWSTNRLLYRGLTAPLVLGRSVVVGDYAGYVHLLSRVDGSPLTWLATDGSAIAATPVAADNTLIVVTRRGGVYGFRPE